MVIRTKLSRQGCFTSFTAPPRSYSEKAEVSAMLKEYGPGDQSYYSDVFKLNLKTNEYMKL